MTREERQRRFPRGARVRTTVLGAKRLWHGRGRTGVVTGHGRKGDWILIRPDGAMSARGFATAFWEIDPTPSTWTLIPAPGAHIDEHW